MPVIGWRPLFWGLAALIALSMAVIAWKVPALGSPRRRAGSAAGQLCARSGRNPYFRRMAPVGFFSYGGMIAMQTLWAGPWMVRVAGYAPLEAATGLFIINVCMLCTFWSWGMLNPWLARTGITTDRLIAWGLPLSLVVLAAIIIAGPAAGAGAWALFCISSTFVSLAQPAVGMAFPAGAGRPRAVGLQPGDLRGRVRDAVGHRPADRRLLARWAWARWPRSGRDGRVPGVQRRCPMATSCWANAIIPAPAMNAILIIAHAPLAHALRQCALHVFPDCERHRGGDRRAAQPVARGDAGHRPHRHGPAAARRPRIKGMLVLTDIFGATPSNVAQKLVDGVRSRLITGVNLPMLLRSVSYRHEPLEALVSRAVDRRHPGRDAGGRHRAAEPAKTKHMIKTSMTISNKLGLHARASAKLTKLAGSYPCEVWMTRGDRRVNAKSIMGVMMLAAGIGSEVELETDGEREQEAMDALARR